MLSVVCPWPERLGVHDCFSDKYGDKMAAGFNHVVVGTPMSHSLTPSVHSPGKPRPRKLNDATRTTVFPAIDRKCFRRRCLELAAAAGPPGAWRVTAAARRLPDALRPVSSRPGKVRGCVQGLSKRQRERRHTRPVHCALRVRKAPGAGSEANALVA